MPAPVLPSGSRTKTRNDFIEPTLDAGELLRIGKCGFRFAAQVRKRRGRRGARHSRREDALRINADIFPLGPVTRLDFLTEHEPARILLDALAVLGLVVEPLHAIPP